MRTYRPAGLIIVPADLNEGLNEAKAFLKAGAGVTYLDRVPPKWKGDSVTSNHEVGAYLATRHLIELGHERIATITGPLTGTSALARLQGYRRAMRSARLPISDNYIQESEFNKNAGHTKAITLLKASPRPTAIFAANDLIAFGVLAAMHEIGIECPRDISVVGFDNLDESDMTSPTLTTVDQFAYKVGASAAQAIIDRVTGKGKGQRHIVLSPELRLKQSTAPPTKSRAASMGRARR
jgi:LacI family transcriptional regulator